MKQVTDRQLEKIILEAAYKAGQHAQKNAYEDLRTRWKKKDDPVTRLDKEAEQMIRKYVSKTIDATFYGEEYGKKKGSSDIAIYIDPIDGTKSFIKKEFFSSTSIAAERNGELVFGAVYDFMKDIMYYANSQGAYMITPEKKRLKLPLKDMPKFSQSNIDVKELDEPYEQYLGDCRLRKQSGSIALAMAQLAAGSYNGMILSPHQKEGRADTCDIAAGYFIMKQAGLHIVDYKLNPFDYKNPDKGIVAVDSRVKNLVREAILETTDPTRIRKRKEREEESVLRAYAHCEERKSWEPERNN